MLTSRSVVSLFSVSLLVLGADVTSGQTYPNKPIRIVTSTVGGGSDFTARFVAAGIEGPLNQRVIVHNRAAGFTPGETVAKATPDGYTLLLGSTSVWIGPLLRKAPFDAVKDFAPISTVSVTPLLVAVPASLPVNSIKELIAYAKAKPGELNYGSGSIGSTTHLAAEYFKSIAGVNIVGIFYASGDQEIPDLISGRVHMRFSSGGPMIPHIKSGKLKALAVTSSQPSVLYPGLPTVAASGLPGFEAVGVDGVLAPANTPKPILNRLSQEIVRYLNTAPAKERMATAGGGDAIGSSPEEFAARIKAEIAKTSKVIKEAGIKVE